MGKEVANLTGNVLKISDYILISRYLPLDVRSDNQEAEKNNPAPFTLAFTDPMQGWQRTLYGTYHPKGAV